MSETIFNVVFFIFGGGHLKYKVIGSSVYCKGGGTGFFWRRLNLNFRSNAEARLLARLWAIDEGGKFVEEKNEKNVE